MCFMGAQISGKYKGAASLTTLLLILCATLLIGYKAPALILITSSTSFMVLLDLVVCDYSESPTLAYAGNPLLVPYTGESSVLAIEHLTAVSGTHLMRTKNLSKYSILV